MKNPMNKLLLTGLLSLCAAASAGAQQQGAGKSGEVPEQYKPPKGMCRIWLKDVPPAQQPAPTDCAAAVKKVPANGRVVWGDTEESKDKPKVTTNAPPNSKPLTGSTTAKPPILPRKPPLR